MGWPLSLVFGVLTATTWMLPVFFRTYLLAQAFRAASRVPLLTWSIFMFLWPLLCERRCRCIRREVTVCSFWQTDHLQTEFWYFMHVCGQSVLFPVRAAVFGAEPRMLVVNIVQLIKWQTTDFACCRGCLRWFYFPTLLAWYRRVMEIHVTNAWSNIPSNSNMKHMR